MHIRQKTLVTSLIIIVVVIAAIVFSLLRQKAIRELAEEEAKPKIAIVIDDWGYNLRCLNLLRQIDLPLTISILPNLRYSSKIAEEAQRLGKEIILHLPLEPEIEGRQIGLEKHTIISDMSEDEIIKNFRLALSSVPYISGVSNHMGSRATKNPRIMSVIFSELKKDKLFFLDNLVTDGSICKSLSAKMEVKFATRDFFLDNSDDDEYIKEQFMKLIEFAQEFGQAVAIAHARRTTLKVLKDMIPLMEEKGIKLVFVSDLVK
jgi:polysaccharide deacetylase 2 family uncharacterized protein YibQ